MSKGSIQYYGDDPNPTRPSEGLRTHVENQADARGRYRGLTVGQVAAVKVADPRTGRESTRYAMVFNAETGNPQVLWFPEDMQLRAAEPSLAQLVASKVRQFPEFLKQLAAGAVRKQLPNSTPEVAPQEL